MTDSVLVCVPCLCFNGSWSSVWPVEASMTEPAICYILDGILLFYCLITTLLFFRAKVGHNTHCLPLVSDTYQVKTSLYTTSLLAC
uniref:Uncharacterized protein n=1 Tax=Salmo trutta TaxID=8032 RepID=A0A673YA58_SALTR